MVEGIGRREGRKERREGGREGGRKVEWGENRCTCLQSSSYL